MTMICPIPKDTNFVISTTKELIKSMRKLRRDLIHCQDCENVDGCQLRLNFQSMIDTAIDEVNQEWNKPTPEIQP
jgi:hypothetical protein